MNHRYLLFMRFMLVNIVAVALGLAAWAQGWLEGLLDPLTLQLSIGITAVFLYGLGVCGLKIWQTSAAINDLKEGGKSATARITRYMTDAKRISAESRNIQLNMLRLKMSHNIQIVRNVANLLVFLGLIGTVIGFIISLSGVEPQSVSQSEKVAGMVATLIKGMSIALYTTLLGAVLNVWLNINYRVLSTGTVSLYTHIVEYGEAVTPFDDFEEGNTETVFRDVILLTLVGFVAMVIMLLPHIQKKQDQNDDKKPPGNVIVEMHWPNDMKFDVDLWVQGPNSTPVGFWNQGNDVFNLLRDDLGVEGDATDENYEVSYSRGIIAGEYIVNVHLYGVKPPDLVVPVNVVVSVRTKYESARQILASTVHLRERNQEETAFKFRLTAEGELVKGSVSTLRHPLITGYRRQGN